MQKWLILAAALSNPLFSVAQANQTADICIYGGTSSGVIAACAAKRAGHSVILLEPGNRIGGLTTGGLGYTDIGNKFAITGMARDFYRRVGKHYGQPESWIFEPHVALEVFQGYLNEVGLTVQYPRRLVAVEKEGNVIRAITTEDAIHPGARCRITAKEFIDCSYEGDLMAKSGVHYFVGREANSIYHETYNGAQLRDKHQFPDGVDPYQSPGNPASGLLWGIDNAPPDSTGTGDKRVQAYNFRICLTNDPANRLPIVRPTDYRADQANCEGREKVDDGIGLAAYTMDSHNARRLAVNGMVKNEGDVQIGGFGPYPVAYRAITPKKEECSNLLVPVCLSASHIAYGSIRMEPVFMVLGQSSALAAVAAIESHTAVQDIDVRKLQDQLRLPIIP